MNDRWHFWPNEKPIPGEYLVSVIDSQRKEFLYYCIWDRGHWLDRDTNRRLIFDDYLVAFRPLFPGDRA